LVVHGIEAWQPTRRRIVNRLARQIDALIAVSDFTRQRFLAWAQPARAQTFLLPNCVDLTRFTPGPKNPALLERYGLRGRLSSCERYKGIDEVLDVLPELAREISNLAYLIVGDGDDRARLEDKARRLGLAERVKFTGWLNDGELVEHYRLADAFVMPGRGEGFGIVYLEALACGVPVVASTADASGEVLQRGAFGVAVNPHRPESIREGVLRVLQWPRGVIPAGLDFFSWENFQGRVYRIAGQFMGTASLPDSWRV
jgi:glycosyltransferase involved in cell wall biosynthesis